MPTADDFNFGFMALVVGSVSLVVLSVVLLLGLALVGGIATGMDETGPPVNKTGGPDPMVGEAVSFEDTGHAARILEVFTVNDSQGNAVKFTGADDSFLSTDSGVDISKDTTWTVSQGTINISNTSKTQILLTIGDPELVLLYVDNGSNDNFSAVYLGTSDSWQVNVSVGGDPHQKQFVQVTRNRSNLTIFHNGTSESTNLSQEGNSMDISTVGNCECTLDETRADDDVLNGSQRQFLRDNPVAPLDGTNRTVRIMYDEGSGTSTAVFFTSTQATLSNISWVSGFEGHVLTEGTDYRIDSDDGTITALSGGAIDDAPVVWIEYRYEPLSNVGELGQKLAIAFGLFSSGVIVIPAVAILVALLGGIFGAFIWLRGQDLELDVFNRPGNR